MRSSLRCQGALIAVFALAFVPSPAHAADPAVKCEVGKLKQAAKYVSCRFKVESKAIAKGVAPDFRKCNNKLGVKWTKLEAKAAGACPTDGDQATMRAAITSQTNRFALWLSGVGPLESLGLPASGQTTAFMADRNDGIAGPVAVPDDGTVRAGATLAYVDNGDGTITDLNTGLMWEKKSDDGGLHDMDRLLRWDDGTQETIWDWLDDVNAEGGTGFAGHSDWRIPNVKELQTIIEYEVVSPSVEPAFDNGCALNCTVTACSCTVSGTYWSASTFSFDPAAAWFVDFFRGLVATNNKANPSRVRAVRGGV